MAKNEKTPKKIAKLASKVLRSKKSSKAAKSLAGSVLARLHNKKKGRKKKK
jgi:hypothetical protein